MSTPYASDMTDNLVERLRDCADALDEFTITFDGKSSKLSGPEIMREAATLLDAHLKAKGEAGELVKELLEQDAYRDSFYVINPRAKRAADTITAQAVDNARLRSDLDEAVRHLDRMLCNYCEVTSRPRIYGAADTQTNDMNEAEVFLARMASKEKGEKESGQ